MPPTITSDPIDATDHPMSTLVPVPFLVSHDTLGSTPFWGPLVGPNSEKPLNSDPVGDRRLFVELSTSESCAKNNRFHAAIVFGSVDPEHLAPCVETCKCVEGGLAAPPGRTFFLVFPLP